MSVAESMPVIDAVITWVDGADPAHRAKLDNFLGRLGGERPHDAGATRFHHAGELDYCVTSLLRFAPWINRIHIVTDDQTPTLINTLKGTAFEDRVRVVDHREIFTGFEQNLPSFNSSSIISLLYRVPDLAERFLFLNDDFALLRPLKPQDFYRDNKVVLRGKWRPFSDGLWYKKLVRALRRLIKPAKPRVSFLAAQEFSARLVGFSQGYFQIPHNPHALLKSTQQHFFADHPELLAANVKDQIRAPNQFVTESLAAHLELKKGNAVIDQQLKTLQLKPGDQSLPRLTHKMHRADQSDDYAFVCVQSLDQGSVERQQAVLGWLDKRIGSLQAFISNNHTD